MPRLDVDGKNITVDPNLPEPGSNGEKMEYLRVQGAKNM